MPFYDSLAKINSNRRARPIFVITYTSIFSKNFCGFLPDTNDTTYKMRTIIASITATLLLTGCCTTAPMFGTQSEKTENFFFDFGKYEAEGFKISPYAWEGNDFTWIGEYSLEKTPAIVRDKQQKTVSMGGGEFQHTKTIEVPVQLPLERDAMLAEFVEAAKAQGADAAVNFEFTVHMESVDIGLDELQPYFFQRSTYRMKAYLIKR